MPDTCTASEFETLCRLNGWKCTVQRFKVYEFLRGNRTHPTVDDVCRAVRQTLPRVSTDSIYRILDQFSEVNVIRKLASFTPVRYDWETAAHTHFVCRSCNAAEDLENIPVPEIPAGLNMSTIGQVLSAEYLVEGICNRCLNQNKGVKK